MSSANGSTPAAAAAAAASSSKSGAPVSGDEAEEAPLQRPSPSLDSNPLDSPVGSDEADDADDEPAVQARSSRRTRLIRDEEAMHDVEAEDEDAAIPASPASPTAAGARSRSPSPSQMQSPPRITAPSPPSSAPRAQHTRLKRTSEQQPLVISDDEEERQQDDEEAEPTPSPEEQDDDDKDEDYGAPARRQPARSTRNAKSARASSRSRRRIASSSEEESASESASDDAEEDDEEQNDSDSSGYVMVASSKRRDSKSAPAPASKRLSKKEEFLEANRGKVSSGSSTAAAAAASASKSKASGSDLSRFFSARASVPGSLSASMAQNYAREREAAEAERKQKQRVARKAEPVSASDDEDEQEQDEEDEESQPARSSRRQPQRSTRTRAPPAPAPAPERSAPRGVRASSRARKEVSYVEKDTPPTDEDERSPSPPPASSKKPAASRSRASAAAALPVSSGSEPEEQDFFDSDNELRQAEKAFTARLAGQRGKTSARAAVSTKRSKAAKAKQRKKARRGSDDDESSDDSAAERAEEREFARKNNLLLSDASSSASGSDDDSAPSDENPIDLILGKRTILVPADPSDPNSNKRLNRVEYLIKYKDLAYMHADWVDRSTIELWKMGRNRITNMERKLHNVGFILYDAKHPTPTTRKLFSAIRETELRVFERDERDGINQRIADEETRQNKRMHPSMKSIQRVWIPRQQHNTQSGESDEEDEGERVCFFDPAYLEVERVVAQRRLDSDPSRVEYLVKWLSLPYDGCTWESDELLGEVIPPEAVARFQRSLSFPTTKQIQMAQALLSDDNKRPKFSLWSEKNPCPPFANGRTLRAYQIEGAGWMNVQFSLGKSFILADEMGLGKTVQTVAHLRTLFNAGLRGPFLVLCPLSCAPHWLREFDAWAPEMHVALYSGPQKARDIAREYEFEWLEALGDVAEKSDLDRARNVQAANRRRVRQMRTHVVIASYDTMRSDVDFFKTVDWQALVVDEAHQIRNAENKLYQCISECTFAHKVFLTGTPIQNKLGEFFTLLNMVDPMAFPSRSEFDARFGQLGKTGTLADVTELHRLLSPYLFRRMKAEVERDLPPREETLISVQMTTDQKQYYRAVFEHNIEFLQGNGTRKNITSLMNVAMELRKVCNHPYLIANVEEQQLAKNHFDSPTSDGAMELLLKFSGKFSLLDKLLAKLKAQGSRVLIFSQMTKVLDILEDYLNWRGYKHERLDGSSRGIDRQAAIDRFSRPDSDRFVFMLSTRAGGIGITLTAADTVVIFDSDANPQGDIQAMARAHRIGQTKTVRVYRLICANTYESDLFDRANMKLGLDKAILHTMDKDKTSDKISAKEVENLLKKGAAWMLKDDAAASEAFCEATIDTILAQNARVINSEDAVGAASARSGLGSFTHATFQSSSGDEVALDDPDFWKKVGIAKAPTKSKASTAKRQHKQIYDLSKPGGRGDAANRDDEDWADVTSGDEASGGEGDDAFGEKRKRGPRGSSSHSQDERVEPIGGVPTADENEKYYSVWPRIQRERFLHALQRYGYHRISELVPYFPGLKEYDLKHVALSFIAQLTIKTKSKANLPATLYGCIRDDLIEHRRRDWMENNANKSTTDVTDASPSKTTAAGMPPFERRKYDALLGDFPIDPVMQDVKFIEAVIEKKGTALTDLNRLAVLHCHMHKYSLPAKKEHAQAQQTPMEVEDATPSVAAALLPMPSPSPEPLGDPNYHISLPATLPPSVPVPAGASELKEHIPCDWWQGELHDPALLLGVYTLGYQGHEIRSKHVRRLWEELRTLPGLPFSDMHFGKAKKKPRAAKAAATAAADANADVTAPMDLSVDGSSKDSEAAPAAGATTASAPPTVSEAAVAADSSSAAVAPAPVPSEAAPAASSDASAPAAATGVAASAPAAASSDSATADAALAASLSAEAEDADSDVLVWPTPQKLKSRFAELISALEKINKSKWPGLHCYKQHGTVKLFGVAAAGQSAKAEKIDDFDLDDSKPNATLLPPPVQWNASQVKRLTTAMGRFGLPKDGEVCRLPAAYFPEAAAKTEAKAEPAEPMEESKSGEPVAAAAAAVPSAVHTLTSGDHWRLLLSGLSGPGRRESDWHDLARAMYAKAKEVNHATLEEKAKNKGLKPAKAAKDKEKDKPKERKKAGQSLEELLAQEVTPTHATRIVDNSQLQADLREELSDAVDLDARLADVKPLPVPFPGYVKCRDDASLIVGVLKHGVGCWQAIRDDPALTVLKILQPEARKKKDAAADKKDADDKETAAAAAGEEEESKQGGESKSTRYDWHSARLMSRLKVLSEHLRRSNPHRHRSERSSDAFLSNPSAASSSSTPSTPSKHAHQVTLGKAFGVADAVLGSPPAAKASPQKKSLSHSLDAAAKPGVAGAKRKSPSEAAVDAALKRSSKPTKPSPIKAPKTAAAPSPVKKATPPAAAGLFSAGMAHNFDEDDILDIDSDSPEPLAKKPRADPAAPKPAPPAVSAPMHVDDSDDFLESPPVAAAAAAAPAKISMDLSSPKRQKLPSGSAAAPSSSKAMLSIATLSPVKPTAAAAAKPSSPAKKASSTSSSSTKKAASSSASSSSGSHKKGQGKIVAPVPAKQSIANFFSVQPAPRLSLTAASNGAAAAAAAAPSSAAARPSSIAALSPPMPSPSPSRTPKRPREDDIIDLE